MDKTTKPTQRDPKEIKRAKEALEKAFDDHSCTFIGDCNRQPKKED